MVMIVFAEENNGRVLAWNREDKDFCEQGRCLVKKHLQQQKLNLNFRGSGLKTKDILELALGMELGTYIFDKYQPAENVLLEQIVLAVDNPKTLKELYKDYAALGNAVRYARDIINESEALYCDDEVYHEIKRLEYLGLTLQNSGKNGFALVWQGEKAATNFVGQAQGRKACALAAGAMKALALQKKPVNVKFYMQIAKKTSAVNDLLAEEVIYKQEEPKTEAQAEILLLELYHKIIEEADYAKR